MSREPLPENPYQSPAHTGFDARDGAKSRHGCATAYLIFMIIVNSLAAVANVFLALAANTAAAPGWLLIGLALFGVLNVVCAVALLRWKRWGFYGFAVSASVIAVINVLSLGVRPALLGLAGLAVLYGVLQIGGERSTWSQLD